MDKKRKMLLLAIFGILTIAIAALLISMIMGHEEHTPNTVTVELPDAATDDIPRAKIKAYETERKVVSYDEYLAEMTSTSSETPQQDSSAYSAQAAIQEQQRTMERIAKKMQEERTEKTSPRQGTSSTHSGGRHTPKADTSGKEAWQQRYDYLLDKIYGKEQETAQQTHSADNKPLSIHQQPSATPTSAANGFITVVGGDNTATKGLIKAATTQETKISAADKVQLRLLQDTQVADMTLPKNTLIYAIAKTDDNRLQLYISSISYNGRVLPVNWAAYDTDGYKGLAYTVDETASAITDEAVSAATNMVGQLASMANRTAGTIIRSTSRMGGRAAKEKQQVITLPQDYQIYLQ